MNETAINETRTAPTVVVTEIQTPVGAVRIAATDDVVVACCFLDHWEHTERKLQDRLPGAHWVQGESAAATALREYFAGDLTAIDALEVEPGGTEFQRRVWAALRTIPVGTTWSYSDLAEATGSASATRAVGSANGANPVSLVVPCHRVIRADGSIGGYGGGLERKTWLLAHEGAALVG